VTLAREGASGRVLERMALKGEVLENSDVVKSMFNDAQP
jgi:hypothetical protein